MNEDSTFSVVRSRLAAARGALSDMKMGIPASEIIARGSKRRTRRVLAAAGAACVAVVTGIAVPLAAGLGSQPAGVGATMQLASYTFRMPAGYLLTDATSSPCRAVAFVTPASLPSRHEGLPYQDAPNAAGMKAAASVSGGCIVAVLLPRYSPTSAVPDPGVPVGARRVQVGRYHGFIYVGRIYVAKVLGVTEHVVKPGWNKVAQLFVQLPAGGGKMRDLVIGARQLSGSALVKIAAQGLSSGNARG